MDVSALCVFHAYGNLKRALNPLELELELPATMWVFGIKPRLPERATNALNSLVTSPALFFKFLFVCFLFFFVIVSLCIHGHPGNLSINQAGLELRNPPASAS